MDILERFLNKVMPEPNTGCWLWIGAKFNDGYGSFYLNGENVRAHRFSYLYHIGAADNLNVCHTCDTPSCVNPQHLFLGTHKQNVEDKVRKGRQAIGMNHGRSKLNWDIVKEIRASEESQIGMSRRYNVSPKAIRNVLNNKNWITRL